MRLNDREMKVVSYLLNGRGEITKQEALDILSNTYEKNPRKRVSDLIYRMKKKGYLAKVKKACYKLAVRTKDSECIQHISPNQTKMWEVSNG